MRRASLSGVHELHVGRNMRFAGLNSKGHFLLRQEHRKQPNAEQLIEDILERLLAAPN